MKLRKKILSGVLAGAMLFSSLLVGSVSIVAKEDSASLERQLIPMPRQYEVNEGKFTLTEDTQFYVEGRTGDETEELKGIAEYVATKFRVSTGFSLKVNVGEAQGDEAITIKTIDNEALGEEGYTLDVTADGVVISANQPAGAFRAVQTLRQLLPASIEKQEVVENVAWDMPYTNIEDTPEYEFRGSHLDVSRHFFTVDEVKRYIDNMAQYKMNKLHLHLSDDQGWRLEMKGEMYGESLSKLNTIGAQTSTNINGIKAGQYTQEEFKEIVAYAQDRYVEIIPEFDMPGHSWAALVSLNFLNSTDDGKPHSGNYDNTKPYEGIDVGFSTFECRNEKTYEFIDEVFRQVSEISPSKYIHIGGDEAHSTSNEDYKYFMNRVTEIAHKYGKIPMGWQDYDNVVEDKENTVTQFWSTGNEKMKEGVKYILSPADYAYMDMKYDSNCSLGLQWAGYNSIKDTYSWEPESYGSKENIIGIEACLWAETLANTDHLDYMAYPKILSHAEIGWTPKELRNWDTYKPRLIAHGERMKNQGIKFFEDETIWEKPYIPVNAEWDLDEGEGNTITDTDGVYSGTLSGDATWGEGKNDSGLVLNGKGWVDLNIEDLKGNWSSSLWVKRADSGSTNAALISGADGELKLEQWKNTQKVGITKFGVDDYTFDYIAPLNEWVHLTFVSDGSTTTLYVNGQEHSKLNVVIAGPAQRIGANAKSDLADSGNMTGSLDEIKIFNRALTAEEVEAIYEGRSLDDDKEELAPVIEKADALTKLLTSSINTKAKMDALKEAIDEVKANMEATSVEDSLVALDEAYEAFMAKDEDKVRIATFNIAANKNPNIAEIVKQMESYGVEIAGIQEIDRNTGRNPYDMMESFKTEAYPYGFFSKAIDYSGGEYGIGTVSSVELKDGDTTMLESNGNEQRVFQRNVVVLGGKEVAFYNTHLSYENTALRTEQMKTLKAAMDSDPVEYRIVVGDFNADQSKDEFEQMFGEDYNIANGMNEIFFDTFNGVDDTMKVYSVDNVIVSKNINIEVVQMIENKLSDHNMFFADITFVVEKTELNELIAEVESMNKGLYTDFSAVEEALSVAKEVAKAETSTQEEVDEAVANLEAALDKLEYKSADYTKVDEAIARANTLNPEDYVDFTAVTKAIEAVVRDLDITNQAKVDAMAEAINDAVDVLEKKPVEPTDLDKPTIPEEDKKPGEEGEGPDSGDTTNVGGLLALLGLAGIAIAYETRKRIR